MIIKCTCKDEWMDKNYGEGNRVMNKTAKTNPPTYRCTVCGKEKTRGDK